jgi:hypothetical protein
MSGYTDNVALDGVATTFAFLRKPVVPDTISHKVREVLAMKGTDRNAGSP